MGGGGPMEGSGPCRRCNQLQEADNDFRRERIDPFAQNAPFPNDNNILNKGIDGNLVGIGNNAVDEENILGGNPSQQSFQGLPGLQGPIQSGTAIDPTVPGGIAGTAVPAPELGEDETPPSAEPHRLPASDEKQSPDTHY